MTLGLEPGRRSVSTVPFHDYYGLIQVYSHLFAGAELVIGESVAFTAELLRQIERARVTDLVGVPYGLRRIFRAAADAGNPGIGGLKVVTSSSETLPVDVLRLIFDLCPEVVVFDVYGLVEAGRACSRAIRRGQEGGRSIGRPAPGTTITAGTPDQPEELS